MPMRRRLRKRLRVALVVLVVGVLITGARHVHVKASHNVRSCFVQLDESGRQLDVRHIALLEAMQDQSATPSSREGALAELAGHVDDWIKELDSWQQGRNPHANVYTKGPWLYHSWRIVDAWGLLPEDRSAAIAGVLQRLAECGIPEPVTTERARAWYHERFDKALEERRRRPSGRPSEAPDVATAEERAEWAALEAREKRLFATFPPTRRPLR